MPSLLELKVSIKEKLVEINRKIDISGDTYIATPFIVEK